MSAAGVFTRMKRVEFVEKSLGEVGDGTAWPIKVTLDQLAEILYRVKDSKFSGAITETIDGVAVEFGFSGDPDTDLVSEVSVYDYDWFMRRGFSATDVAGFTGYFGEGYSVGGTEYFDIGSNERGIWTPAVTAGSSFRTGLSHEFSIVMNGYLETEPLPSHYLAYNAVGGVISPAGAILTISREVAWVDANSSGNPFDSNNEIWLGLTFDIWGTLYFTTFASTSTATAGNDVYTGLELELELSSGVLSCPIYFSTGDDTASFSGTIRIEATAWWPYAKPGGPVWNSGTGAKL
jgi:hypothetical protein